MDLGVVVLPQNQQPNAEQARAEPNRSQRAERTHGMAPHRTYARTHGR